MAAEPLDNYIDAVAKALARLVDEFPLPDETEPASVYTA